MKYDGEEVSFENCRNASVFTLNHIAITDAEVYMIGEEIRLVFAEDCYDKLDAQMRVVFYDGELGVVSCCCNLYEYRFERNERGKVLYGSGCNILEIESIVQRRADYKVRIKVPFEIMIKDNDEGGGMVPATAVDISAGGIGFCSTYPFSINERITFTLKLEHRMLLQAEILHKDPANAEPGEEARYGCRFIGLKRGVEGALRQYAYRRQILENKATRNDDRD